MSKLIVKKGAPIIIKGNSYKFIDELLDILRISKLRFNNEGIIINPRYGLGE